MSKSAPLDDYWNLSRQPLTSLFFILPFLVVYEVGTFLQATGGSRNGADIWLRQALLDAGVSAEWLFPLLVPAALMAWQLWKRPKWTCQLDVLGGMFGESLLYAMSLVAVGRLVHVLVTANVAGSMVSRSVSFLGAGIYEELLFRLLLIPLIYLLLRVVRLPIRWCVLGSIIVSSAVFSVAHYVQGDACLTPSALSSAARHVAETPAAWYSFSFRLLAGVTFSVLFWVRGFGITAGCHLLYDLIVGVMLGSLRGE